VRKRIAVLSAGIVVVTSLGAGIALGRDSTSSSSASQTLRLIVTQAELTYVDLGTTGPSLGDMLVKDSGLRAGARRVGHAPISCVFISTRGAPRCDAELVLSRGTIMLQGILTNPRFVFAVTGGTGIYRNASGDVHGRVLRGERVALTVNLLGVGGGSALAGRA
jgi:hypothetical protein